MTRDEHEPPHVHVEHPDGAVVVLLDEGDRLVRVRKASRRMKASELRVIVSVVDEHFEELLIAWKRLHR